MTRVGSNLHVKVKVAVEMGKPGSLMTLRIRLGGSRGTAGRLMEEAQTEVLSFKEMCRQQSTGESRESAVDVMVEYSTRR